MNNFSEQHIEVLREVINIGVGKGAGILNTMLNAHIDLQVPFVKIFERNQIIEYFRSMNETSLATVNLPFRGKICGSAKLVFPTEGAAKLVSAFTGETIGNVDLDSIRVGTLNEIGNIVINAVMGSVSNLLSMHFDYSVPRYMEGDVEKLLPNETNYSSSILLAKTRFKIDKFEVAGDFIIYLEVGYVNSLKDKLDEFIHSTGI